MKTIIAGGRDITAKWVVDEAVRESGFEITEVVSGRARGVDFLGEAWAHEKAIPIVWFEAHWSYYGRKAGPIRNALMSEYADALLAIWDGKSAGTRDMIEKAQQNGLRVYVYAFKPRKESPYVHLPELCC